MHYVTLAEIEGYMCSSLCVKDLQGMGDFFLMKYDKQYFNLEMFACFYRFKPVLKCALSMHVSILILQPYLEFFCRPGFQ